MMSISRGMVFLLSATALSGMLIALSNCGGDSGSDSKKDGTDDAPADGADGTDAAEGADGVTDAADGGDGADGVDGVDPTTLETQDGTWTPMAVADSFVGSSNFICGVISGGKFAVFDSRESEGSKGSIYDLAAKTWKTMSMTNAPSTRASFNCAGVGDYLVVWGGYDGNSFKNALTSGAIYSVSADTWTAIDSGANLVARSDALAIAGKDQIFIFGGRDAAYFPSSTGALVNPATGVFTPVSTTGIPNLGGFNSLQGLAGAWTGKEFVVWNGNGQTGGAYDPATNTWRAMSATGAPGARELYDAVWTGTHVIFFGAGADGKRFAGTRYDPAGDSWSALPDGGWKGRAYGVAANDKHLYVVRGTDVMDGAIDAFDFDLATSTWKTVDFGIEINATYPLVFLDGTSLVVFNRLTPDERGVFAPAAD